MVIRLFQQPLIIGICWLSYSTYAKFINEKIVHIKIMGAQCLRDWRSPIALKRSCIWICWSLVSHIRYLGLGCLWFGRKVVLHYCHTPATLGDQANKPASLAGSGPRRQAAAGVGTYAKSQAGQANWSAFFSCFFLTYLMNKFASIVISTHILKCHAWTLNPCHNTNWRTRWCEATPSRPSPLPP